MYNYESYGKILPFGQSNMIIKRKCVSTRIFLWIIGLIFIFPHRRLFPYRFPVSPKTEHIPACFDHAVPDWNFNKLKC